MIYKTNLLSAKEMSHNDGLFDLRDTVYQEHEAKT